VIRYHSTQSDFGPLDWKPQWVLTVVVLPLTQVSLTGFLADIDESGIQKNNSAHQPRARKNR
jgi:hypothetical protein